MGAPDAAVVDGETVTTPPSFPTLAGLGWSVHKKPVFSTLVASHVSGREVRDALYQNPIWQFELAFDGLSSSPTSYSGLGGNSMQALLGFFLQMQGQFGTFLYNDPTDSAATNETFATGDGATTTFAFSRFMGAFLEPVGWVTSVSNVFLNNVNQPSGWSLSTPNSLVFASAPELGDVDCGDLYLRVPMPVRFRRPRLRGVHVESMEGRQRQVQIGEDVVKISVGPLELARRTIQLGMRRARSLCLSQAPFARMVSQFSAARSEDVVMLAVGALAFLACATAMYLPMASLRKLSWS